MIRQDVRANEFNRQFDVDALIESITQDSVTWFGRGDNENTMSYNSFRKNVLVDVRSKLGRQNKTSSSSSLITSYDVCGR